VRFFTENKVEIVRYLSEPGETPAVRRPIESGA
jgi:malonate-semialdehyde dehydrogenase (acetylating) / methylmalonate-semialdehyde dehydrogenase